jgi:hypothetical protein
MYANPGIDPEPTSKRPTSNNNTKTSYNKLDGPWICISSQINPDAFGQLQLELCTTNESSKEGMGNCHSSKYRCE